MKGLAARKLRVILLTGYLIFYGASAPALDNPDAPDYVGKFLSRTQAHESEIQRAEHNTQGYVRAYAAYENFLNEELNKAYKLLMGHLDEGARRKLRNSQRKWLKHRDAEFEFVSLNWTTENFGSSSVISKGNYRTTIVKHRVTLLMHYLKNYLP